MFVVREVLDGVARYSLIYSSYEECLRRAKIRRGVLNSNWSIFVVSLCVSSVECVAD